MDDPKNIDEALLILQINPPILKKDKDGQVGSQKTKYADLVQANEVILSRLTELGVLWKTRPTLRTVCGPGGQEDVRFVLDWELRHVASGTSESGEYPLPNNVDPMRYGSAITYARRYALLAITNAVAEDDDDDGAGYRGRQGAGMAQRASARQQPSAATAQRAAPPVRPERARPEQQPALPEPVAPKPAGGGATNPQLGKLAGELGKLGITERAARLTVMSTVVGRQIQSGSDLTKAEAHRTIEAIIAARGKYGDEDAWLHLRDEFLATENGRGVKPKPNGAERTRSAREALGGDRVPSGELAPWDGELQVPAGDGP